MKKLILLLIIIFNFSCNYTDNVINPITQNPVDVYLAGQKNGHACYWKNNQEYVLDDIGLFDSKATKIIIFNNDVHILCSSSDGTSLYWKNNVVINLSSTLAGDDYEVDNIGDMEINGNDVYFSGQVLGNVFGSETSDMCFWKNGQLNKI